MNESDDWDMLAAEYVLGTLDAAEREGVASRLGADAELSRAVDAWEDRLSPLLVGVQDVAPPTGAYAGIVARVFGDAIPQPGQASDGALLALRRRVRLWQMASGSLGLLAASLLAWVVLRDGPSTLTAQRFTAVLQRDAGAPAMVIEVDLAARRLTVVPVAAVPPSGHAYELWIIAPALGEPRSLGLVSSRGDDTDALIPLSASVITEATYAVTVEAAGGSPTGRPTTAPVLTGRLSPSRS